MQTLMQPDRRAHPRYRVAPMYTSVAARLGESRRQLAGHLYDISEGGCRLELDEPVTPGEAISVDLGLPGETSCVNAEAQVVWVADAEDDPGPRRLAVRFLRFADAGHHDRLVQFLESGHARQAA